jgi:hypothetical protein
VSICAYSFTLDLIPLVLRSTTGIEVLQIDLLTGEATEMFRVRLQDTLIPPSSVPTLRGDFFAIAIKVFKRSFARLLIVNWRSKTYALLHFPSSLVNDIAGESGFN